MADAQEKLYNFSNIVISSAEEKCRKILEESENKTKKALLEYEDKCLEKAYSDIQKQKRIAQKCADSTILKEKTAAKKEKALIKKQMTDDIFSAVLDKFNRFKESDEYGEFLIATAKAAAAQTDGGSKITIYIDSTDAKYEKQIEETLSGVKVCVLPKDEDIAGGVIAVQEGTNRIINHSVKESLENAKEAFPGSGRL